MVQDVVSTWKRSLPIRERSHVPQGEYWEKDTILRKNGETVAEMFANWQAWTQVYFFLICNKLIIEQALFYSFHILQTNDFPKNDLPMLAETAE